MAKAPFCNPQHEWTAAKIDRALDPVLRKMEKQGVLLDIRFLEKMRDDLTKKLTALAHEIHRYAQTEFNINSPAQLGDVLFNKLKLSPAGAKRTGKGAISTSVDTLHKLEGKHPIIEHILKYRQLEKLRSTYLEPLPRLADKNHRIHTTFAQETSTGRLSSSAPNLQNIPERTELGAEIRKAFIAPKGYTIISADYSQIELRVVASLAHDAKMIETFQKGEDIHTRVASEVLGKPQSAITKAERSSAKAINFGILYGMSAYGLAQRTGMTQTQAQDYIDKYFELYPGVATYVKAMIAHANEKGYVETLFGRRREIPELKSPILHIHETGKRMAVNTPIHGTAADLIKIAMIHIDKKLPKVSKDSRMILQVHDELIFETPNKDVKKVVEFVKDQMENVCELPAPIAVEVETGENWEETK
jgi:DNA polymerase-1